MLFSILLLAAGVSAGCTAALLPLATGGELSSCLSLSNILPLLNAQGSIVDQLNNYTTALCDPSTPTCSNETLAATRTTIEGSCQEDVAAGRAPALLLMVLNGYTPLHAAACAKNATTNVSCVTQTLQTVQNATGTNITLSLITGAVSGNTSALETFSQAFGTGQLCTGCMSQLYQQAVIAQPALANASTAMKAQCGQDFGTTPAQNVTGVSPNASAADSSAPATASPTASPAAGSPTPSPAAGALGLAPALGSLAVALAAALAL